MRDLEVYIRDLAPGQLSSWLGQHLDELELDDAATADRAVKGSGRYYDSLIRVSIYPGAMGKRYSCIVLEGAELPWNGDLDCARSAWRSLDAEVRCSPGDWKEGDPVDDEKWWRIDQRGEQLVVWN